MNPAGVSRGPKRFPATVHAFWDLKRPEPSQSEHNMWYMPAPCAVKVDLLIGEFLVYLFRFYHLQLPQMGFGQDDVAPITLEKVITFAYRILALYLGLNYDKIQACKES